MILPDPKIVDLQQSLNRQGFDLVVDGRYGKKTADAYAEYLDRDSAVPTMVPPAPIPWWASKTAIAILGTILGSAASLAGLEIDSAHLAEVISASATLALSVMALWANGKRKAPIDNGLVLPGMRIDSSSDTVPAKRKSNKPAGPFGY